MAVPTTVGSTAIAAAALRSPTATQLGVPGVWKVEGRPDGDGPEARVFDRALVRRLTGVEFDVRQLNTSVSHKDVVRGVHWVQAPPGQVKYVFCPAGRVLDMVVDLRSGSPTFGASDSVELSGCDARAVLIPPGVGHCFLSRADGSVLSYLSSCTYDPERERTIHPFDPALRLPLEPSSTYIVSDRDRTAPRLGAFDKADLPTFG